jgi:hypothetical protein
MYIGDITLGVTFDHFFTTRRFSTGAPHTLAGTPVISAYEDNGTTEITAGITLTADFDSRTGLNHVRVVATGGNGFEAGKSYYLVITAGTVDSVSVVGEVIGSFTIGRAAAFERLGAPAGASVSADILTIDNLVDDLESRLGTPTGASIAADIADVEGKVDDLEGRVVGTIAAGTHNPQSGDSFTRLGAPVGASISADIAAVKAAVDVIDDFLDTEIAAILAAVDTEVAAIKAKTDNLPSGIVKNAALNNFKFFMVDSADHFTGKTGLAVTAERAIDGGAFAACANAVVEVAAGVYRINLAATDTNGDHIMLKFTAAGADATFIGFKTQTN